MYLIIVICSKTMVVSLVIYAAHVAVHDHILNKHKYLPITNYMKRLLPQIETIVLLYVFNYCDLF